MTSDTRLGLTFLVGHAEAGSQAAAYGDGLIVDALQKAGADPSLANNKTQTAYAIAREQYTAAIDYLKSPIQ